MCYFLEIFIFFLDHLLCEAAPLESGMKTNDGSMGLIWDLLYISTCTVSNHFKDDVKG